MSNIITLQKGGLQREFKTGFSWSYFFLGAWLPMFKGKLGKSFKHSFLFIVTLTVYYWIQSFKGWNKGTILDAIERGWQPLTENDTNKLNQL